MKKTEMSRKQAAKFIEDVLLFVAQLEEGVVDRKMSPESQLSIGNRLRSIAAANNITDIPRKCNGEAHDPEVGGRIDNCGSCMPHWGYVCSEVKIR